MIDNNEFKRAWGAIVERFGKEFNPKVAAAYYEFLSPLMETDEFLTAARTIWATAKWFPRPADFLMMAAGDEWRLVDAWADPALCEVDRDRKWARLSPRAQEAVRRIGGLRTLQAAKDPLRLKSEWERAYEQATASEVLALPPAPTRPALSA